MATTRSTSEITQRLQDCLHQEVKDLDRAGYREVLESMQGDVEAALEALDQEEKADARTHDPAESVIDRVGGGR